jgi:hypothetical protein
VADLPKSSSRTIIFAFALEAPSHKWEALTILLAQKFETLSIVNFDDLVRQMIGSFG